MGEGRIDIAIAIPRVRVMLSNFYTTLLQMKRVEIASTHEL
jgi:hypothetical protein